MPVLPIPERRPGTPVRAGSPDLGPDPALDSAATSDRGFAVTDVFRETLGNLLKARFPLLCVESFEEHRVLAEIVAAPVFADFEVEKKILREELLDDLDDEGRDVAVDWNSNGYVRGLLNALVVSDANASFTFNDDGQDFPGWQEPLALSEFGVDVEE